MKNLRPLNLTKTIPKLLAVLQAAWNGLQRRYLIGAARTVKPDSIQHSALVLSFLLGPAALPSLATPATPELAARVAEGWLLTTPTPLGTPMSRTFGSVETYRAADGKPLYHVLPLQHGGFIITAADTELEPIIAFSDSGLFDPDPRNPLRALLDKDLAARTDRAAQAGQLQTTGPIRPAVKWAKLAQRASAPSMGLMSNSRSDVDDVRVAPFLDTKWGQTTSLPGLACYNFYTPPYPEGPEGASTNYPCGCVSTALAQIMYRFQYPTQPVGQRDFKIHVDGVEKTRTLRGGDARGGPYQWDLMPRDPRHGATDEQRRAIGALTSDIGIACGMMYNSAESSANAPKARETLTGVFKFKNAILASLDSASLPDCLNANLDARLPVFLGILGPSGGHAVVCDGYGYVGATPYTTLYHHINLGWGSIGNSDAWYNLPIVDPPEPLPQYTIISAICYNIFTDGTGEIISGRVVDSDGSPVANASVTAVGTGGGTHSATTDSNGIYALARIPSASQYAISVTKLGYESANWNFSTGTSQDKVASGNHWGADLTLAFSPAPLILVQPTNQSVVVGANVTFTVASSGIAPFSYQWHFKGKAIAGATNGNYTIPSVQTDNAGDYAVNVSNPYGSVKSVAATLAVTWPSSDNVVGVIGVPFTYQINADNNPTSFEASGLPSGLGYNATSGLISGTPTVTGTFPVRVVARNLFGSASATIPITINPGAITSADSALGVIGVPFIYQITANNNPTAYEASGMPPGVGYVVTSGVISGTPTVTGTFPVQVVARNLFGSASTNVLIAIGPGSITSATSAQGVIGVPFTYQITADNNPTSFEVSNLPPGVGWSAISGLISGVPSVTGIFPVQVVAKNPFGTASATVPLTIKAGSIIIQATSGSGGVQMSWRTLPGYRYQIKKSIDLGGWTNEGNPITGTGDLTSYIYKSPTAVPPTPGPTPLAEPTNAGGSTAVFFIIEAASEKAPVVTNGPAN